MRLQKAFTKEGSVSCFPFPCMVCYLSYAEPSSAYKGRENNSLSLLRIGKQLYEPSPPLLLKKEEEDLKKDKK